ncbi:MAG: hypothetical protein LBD31_00525 [Treponema sp.]|jgi:predicted membrane protein|nr:hypothetical protein [Treponema sp.]
MSFKEFFGEKSVPARAIFILIILYVICSIVVLLLALGIVLPRTSLYLNPYTLIGFSVVSFGFTVLISVYHLSTLIRRRKRKTDR